MSTETKKTIVDLNNNIVTKETDENGKLSDSAELKTMVEQDERIQKEHDRLLEKYGKSLTNDMIKKKLAQKRKYFDSADYFKRVAEGDQPDENTEAPLLYVYTRTPEGDLKRDNKKHNLKEVLAAGLQAKRKHFDSADWAMQLEGVLEHPSLPDKPHPVMFYFSQDSIGVVTHPDAKGTPESDLKDMCEAAESELRKRYGVAGKLSQKQVLKINLRAKKRQFDSADWALRLQGVNPDL
mmetsp:Transcript_11135/g.18646  ORF Transcript_11135/g.18646 Transcript_11135/m.18646 type:complete len:238 (+) Transcript_11135:86-799(+)